MNHYRRHAAGLLIASFCLMGASTHADSIYVSDSAAGAILKYDDGGSASLFASGLNTPTGLAFDQGGNLYVASAGSGTIEKLDSAGNASLFATGLSNPSGLAFNANGDLFVGDAGTGSILKFDANGVGSTFASGLNGPLYLAFDGSGNLYASTLQTIAMFGPNGGATSVYSCANYIYGLAFNQDGGLFASLQNAASIVQLGGSGFSFDDPFHTFPTGLAFDDKNNLYVTLGNTIMEFDSAGGHSSFASGLDQANYITIQPVPEPSVAMLLLVGVAVMLQPLRSRGLPPG